MYCDKFINMLKYINTFIYNNIYNNNILMNSNFTNFTYIPEYLYTNKKSYDMYYNRLNLNNKKDMFCSICMNNITNNDDKIITLKDCNCKYEYHSKCIDMWLDKNLNCPICRKDLSIK